MMRKVGVCMGRRAKSTVALEHIVLGKDSITGDSGEPLLLVHGMLGNMNNWRTVARKFAAETGRAVYCVDLRNHGKSPHHEGMSYDEMANDLAHFIEKHVKQQVVLVGHSLGGKAAMNMCLGTPEHVNSLVVADIAPVDYNAVSNKRKAISLSLSYIKILKSMPTEVMHDLAAADKYLEDHGVEFKAIRQFLLTNLKRNITNKTATWAPNLAAMEANLEDGTLAGFDPKGRSAPDTRTLVITGSASPYVKMERDAALFNRYFPLHTHHEMEGVGHWLHAEDPNTFTRVVSDWIAAA